MKTHAAVGSDLLRPMRTLERVFPLVRHHHEKLDGSGYPDGLRGGEIPLLVRITSVVDVFDAPPHPALVQGGVSRREVPRHPARGGAEGLVGPGRRRGARAGAVRGTVEGES
jgi:response regulator RpfG family c-di-GMP phosphodiesterase